MTRDEANRNIIALNDAIIQLQLDAMAEDSPQESARLRDLSSRLQDVKFDIEYDFSRE